MKKKGYILYRGIFGMAIVMRRWAFFCTLIESSCFHTILFPVRKAYNIRNGSTSQCWGKNGMHPHTNFFA